MSKILIVEDDEDWIDLISNELKDKISHAVTKSILYKNQDYEFFISQINEIKPNLVIFDINMGNDPKAGIKLAKYIKQNYSDLVFVFLTSQKKDDPLVMSNAAEVGAATLFDKSDFINDLDVLSNFIKNLLDKDKEYSNIIKVPPLEMDYQARMVKLYDENISLTRMEFEVLFHLAKNKNQIFSNYQLYDNATNEAVQEGTFEGSIVSHIKAIRDKFKKIDANFNPIITVQSFGYKYNYNSDQ